MTVDASRRSVSTRSISRDFARAVRCAAEAGFAAIEVWEEDILPLGGVPFLRSLIDELGVAVAQYQLLRNVDGVAEPRFLQSLEDARRLLEGARQVSADSVLVAATIEDIAVDDFDLAAEQLSRLVELAVPYGVRIAYEALPFGRVHRRVADAWRLVSHIDHPNLGITLDSTHMALMGDPVAQVSGFPADRIFFVQIADLPRVSGDWLALSRTERLFPGEGIVDICAFMRAIERTGYQGYCSLEVFNRENEKQDPMAVARRAADSFGWLLDRVGETPPAAPLPDTLVAAS